MDQDDDEAFHPDRFDDSVILGPESFDGRKRPTAAELVDKIRHLLRARPEDRHPVTVRGLKIRGDLLLHGIGQESAPAPLLRFRDCRLAGLRITRCALDGLVLDRCRIDAVELWSSFLSGDAAITRVSARQLHMREARLGGTLMFSDILLVPHGGLALDLVGSRVGRNLVLQRIRLRGDLVATGVHVGGNLEIRGEPAKRSRISGAVYAGFSRIGGNVVVAYSDCSFRGEIAVLMDNAEIGGTVWMEDSDLGAVLLSKSRISGDVELRDIRCLTTRAASLDLAEAQVGGSLRATQHANQGPVPLGPAVFPANTWSPGWYLAYARIGGNIRVADVRMLARPTGVSGQMDNAIDASSIHVGGYLAVIGTGESPCELGGSLIAARSSIGDTLYLENIAVAAPANNDIAFTDRGGVRLDGCSVAGYFAAVAVRGRAGPIALSLAFARVGQVHALTVHRIEPGSPDDVYDFAGLTYSSIRVDDRDELVAFLACLDSAAEHQISSSRRESVKGAKALMATVRARFVEANFVSQPFVHLAGHLAAQGQVTMADATLRRMHQWQRRAMPLGPRRAASALFDLMFGYGYGKVAAVVTLSLWIAAGIWGTVTAIDRGMLVVDTQPVSMTVASARPSQPAVLVSPPDLTVAAIPCVDAIDPVFYAVEVILPIFDLGQKKQCTLVMGGDTGKPWIWREYVWWWAAKYVYTIGGWIVTLLTVLTVMGTLKGREK